MESDPRSTSRNSSDVVWCPLCNSEYHRKCTGVTYDPYVFTPDETGFICHMCLNKKSQTPGFISHLGTGPESMDLLAQVS